MIICLSKVVSLGASHWKKMAQLLPSWELTPISMILPTWAPGKIHQTSPNPRKERNSETELLVKGPGAHLPGGPVGENLDHGIHGIGIFTYMDGWIFMANVGKHTIHPMGYTLIYTKQVLFSLLM